MTGSNFGSSTSGQQSNTNFNASAQTVKNNLSDGDRFVLVIQSRGSEQPRIWSSGDVQETQQMVQQASTHLQRTPETTG